MFRLLGGLIDSSKNMKLPDHQKAYIVLTVDTYGVQHPGRYSAAEQNVVQSVNIHFCLIGLHLSIAENKPASYVVRCMDEILTKKRDFDWLTPPSNPHWLTVQDVIKAQTAEEHLKTVRAWAESMFMKHGVIIMPPSKI